MLENIVNGENVRDVLLHGCSDLTEMANMVGKRVKTDHINFSFYFSTKSEVNHSIRAKVKWNKDHLAGGTDGYFELHGNYAWVQSPGGEVPDGNDLKLARRFFRKYKVLFAAVWEECLDANDVQDYFKGLISFSELLVGFLIGSDFSGVHDLKGLEDYVRKNSLFNMND